MKKTTLLILLSISLLSFLSGCTRVQNVYVCADGTETLERSECGINKIASVSQKDAEKFAQNFVKGYIVAAGGKAQLVSTYLDTKKGDYMSTFIVTEKEGGPFETVVSIDGKTGQVDCNENCEYTGVSA